MQNKHAPDDFNHQLCEKRLTLKFFYANEFRQKVTPQRFCQGQKKNFTKISTFFRNFGQNSLIRLQRPQNQDNGETQKAATSVITVRPAPDHPPQPGP